MLNMTEIITTIKRLIAVRLKMIKSEIMDALGLVIARIVMLVSMVMAAMFVLLVGSIALAFYFSEIYESSYIGFLLLTGIYFLIFLLLFIVRNSPPLQRGLQNTLSKFVFLFKNK